MEEVKKMMDKFQENLNAALAAGNPEVSPTISMLEGAFKLFQKVVMDNFTRLDKRLVEIEARQAETVQRQAVIEERLDVQEQYSRRSCLLIRGIPETDKKETEEDCLRHVMDILNGRLKLQMSEEVVSRCHRLGGQQAKMSPTNSRGRPIIVKFYSYRHRRLVYGAKKLLKGTNISVTEFLTMQRMEIYRIAKNLFTPKQCWTSDGKIIILVPQGNGQMKRVVVTKKTQIPPPPPTSTLPGSNNSTFNSPNPFANVNLRRGTGATQEES